MTLNYDKLKELDHSYLWHPFTQMQEWLAEEPCIIEQGEGHYLIDVNGRRYLDGVSSLWCNIHGHRKKELDDAIRAQLDRISHSTFLGLSHVPGIQLAQKLVEVAPKGLQRVFYSDSGASAVEVALKMAVQYWQLKGETKRTLIASLAESYHGDTVGSMSLGYSETFHRYHKNLLFPVLRITPPHVFRYYEGMNEMSALDAAIGDAERKLIENKNSLAALVMEPLMQGAAGMWAQPVGYLQALHEICRRNGILLVLDEVATGFGRTGKMFACEHAGVTPDILCLAKGITGGYLPLAATLTSEEVFAGFLGEYKDFKTFFHGHTYTGNPLGCAVALANLELFRREKIVEKMQPAIPYLHKRLSEEFLSMSHVSDVRQWGFMVGIELVEDKAVRKGYPPENRIGHRVIIEARKRDLMIRPLGDIIILMPPLSITDAELALLLDTVRDSIQTRDGKLMRKAVFITGTDTGVGKTFFACRLAALLREFGYRVGVMKPVETGCAEREGKIFPPDAILLKEASGSKFPLDKICPYQLLEPLAPSVAAERQGISINADRLMDIYEEISSSHDVTLVEGAGGLMVPLLPSYTYADFARVLRLPAIVVAANRLGAINHLLLTLEHARCKGVSVLGYVLNRIESEASLAAETNREALSTLSAVRFAGELPYFANFHSVSNATLDGFAEQFDLRTIESVLHRREAS